MQQDMQENFFEAINDLTKKVRFLYIEREQQGAQQAQDMEVQILSVTIHTRRSPILIEERKEIIYECPKFLGMKYTPPPLNEAATSAAQKNDAALTEFKCPIIIIQGNEDLEFAHTMRELLSDVASSITQNRINNLHKSMGLPARVSILVEPTVKLLVENKQLDALLAAKKPTARSPTNNLNTKNLTAKSFWLIAVCGFLRASDIHRVDYERTEISNNSIKLIICAPKKKRKSSPIERLVEIKAHSDEILCPVIAYKIYKQRIANISCPKPDVNDKNLKMNHLFRNTKDFSKPLTVDSISRIIKSIAIIAVKDKKEITPKAKAIEATIAARTGISTDKILTQANWSSYYMFSSYYKLSKDFYSNITESVLSELT
ncbi:hypothetical protein BB561_004514 [Smittium simulii]|uniref:Tyr recombinase domain-containing protein n=1 Tax=Smittium simulii TaxID=133385 RepID=A0A2T9YFS7_9FUNG|nr:hypothetical protein BB561_004514 [Smittium simulii]